MATNRNFAYNTGGQIAGTEQVGSIAIGTPTAGFAATGKTWRLGPDEDLGYIIAYTTTGQRTAGGGTEIISGTDIGYKRSIAKTDNSFITLANGVGASSFASASAAKTWLNANGYWTSWVSAGVSFVGSFVQGQAPTTTVETAWNTFRAALTGTYTTFTISSTNGSSVTATHASNVQTLANALRNATNNTSVTINGVVWRVGTGCGTPKIGGVAVEFSNIGSCTASSTVALRPMINNLNWGGIGTGSTVNQATQTITLTFS
jgi:hypothetical protein